MNKNKNKNNIDEYYLELKDLIYLFWEGKYIIFFSCCVFSFLSFLYVNNLPVRYEVKASFIFDNDAYSSANSTKGIKPLVHVLYLNSPVAKKSVELENDLNQGELNGVFVRLSNNNVIIIGEEREQPDVAKKNVQLYLDSINELVKKFLKKRIYNSISTYESLIEKERLASSDELFINAFMDEKYRGELVSNSSVELIDVLSFPIDNIKEVSPNKHVVSLLFFILGGVLSYMFLFFRFVFINKDK
ncbi:hypothetical protein MACH09_01710 [Vibrio sp. MACH09]|uniref:hypothetical protein n=1 Tax=Vibrio sp. MACH09 TaxID=3025122 RepID=UPI00278FAA46|nr:hypothetical protein [Vibrio sp. MACH09]GLO59663.1 hypothetical protein MACH09_01710 [Vibrio sp. MACH09]